MPDALPFRIRLRRFFGDPALVRDFLDRFEHEVSAGFYHGIHNVLDGGGHQKCRCLRRRRRFGTARRSNSEQTCDQNPTADPHDFPALVSMISDPGCLYTPAIVLHATGWLNSFM